MSEKMNNSITILVDDELDEAIEKYIKLKRINRSSFIRGLITDKLIEEKIITKEEKNDGIF
jgi:hypothetical protein